MSEIPVFRPAVVADLDQIIAMDTVVEVRASRKTFLQNAVDRGECHVTTLGKLVAGFIVLEYTFFGHALISLLIVAKPYRRRGLGTALIRHAEQLCRTPKIFTSTNESNEIMRLLLPRLGFQQSGRIDNIDDGDPELIFFKRL